MGKEMHYTFKQILNKTCFLLFPILDIYMKLLSNTINLWVIQFSQGSSNYILYLIHKLI